MEDFLPGLLFAIIGAVLLDRFRLPAGSMVGALLGVFLAGLLGRGVPAPHPYVVTGISIVVGIILAVRFSKKLVVRLGKLLLPACFVAVVMVALGYGLGYALTLLTDWNAATASFSVYPGGLEQMVLVAGSLGGNVYIVTTVQLVRWLTVVTTYPLLFHFFKPATNSPKRPSVIAKVPVDSDGITTKPNALDILWIILAVAGGVVAHIFNLPAGALLGSFVTLAVFRGLFASKSLLVAPVITKLILAVVGFVMGSGVDTEQLVESGDLLLVAIALTALLLAFSLTLAYILHRMTGWNKTTCFIAMAPAGTVEMTLLAEQLNLDPTPIFTLHFTRTVTVIVFAPILYALTFG